MRSSLLSAPIPASAHYENTFFEFYKVVQCTVEPKNAGSSAILFTPINCINTY